MSFHPRICCIPLKACTLPDLEARLARIASLGFDHVLVFAPAGEAVTDECLAPLIAAARTHGLAVLLDLAPDRFDTDDPLVADNLESLVVATTGTDALPDPRIAHAAVHELLGCFDTDAGLAAATEYWQRRIASWRRAGVGGFRCTAPARVPVGLWRQLIAANAGLRFLAWTPGCTPAQVAALRGCGFAAVFSSLAWWDFRSDWLVPEHRRLAAVAPVIACPEAPGSVRLARLHGAQTVALQRRAALRVLRVAAAIGDGLMVPLDFESGVEEPLDAWQPDAARPFDLSGDVREANDSVGRGAPIRLTQLSAPGAPVACLLRDDLQPVLVLANADLEQAQPMDVVALRRQLGELIVPLHDGALMPGEVQLHACAQAPRIATARPSNKRTVTAAARVPRIAIEAVAPLVDAGRFPVKRIVGESVTVEADIFSDGHDKLAAALAWRDANETEWQTLPMHHVDNDRWQALLPLQKVGRHVFSVQAWLDRFATYRYELQKKTEAQLDVTLEIEEGTLLVESTLAALPQDSALLAPLQGVVKSLRAKGREGVAARNAARVAVLLAPATLGLMQHADPKPFVVHSVPFGIVDAERRAAQFASWYELFPRSQSGDPKRHGTFDDVIARLPAIAAMGFDTLYLPPIHPIGKAFRKGPNNTLTPGPDDPGSPYAIGSEEGGHTAVHPQLGTLEDFRRLCAAATAHGMEMALDFAIQCSPDHPWLRQHPEWFDWRPDGSIRHAENPPKKYQDIVNVDFYADGAIPSLWLALRDVVLFWVAQGVRLFRVDNPHTKPLPFWEWMIGDVRSVHPDVVFLSEAFTRPKPMYRLAKIGFSQSYTYFTWRHTKREFIDYLTELTTTAPRDFFRPHFFVNTPDINPFFLQQSGRAGFVIRAALATTLSGLWGMYSGFELCEAAALPGREEYLDSEKYEIRAWDWQRPGNIIAEITLLNQIRHANPALQTHLSIRFLESGNDHVLVFIKEVPGNRVVVAINLDPFAAQHTHFALPHGGQTEVEDLVHHTRLSWQGQWQQVHLDPFDMPFAIWRITIRTR